MTHRSVLVCLPADTDTTTLHERLGHTLARWDAESDIEPDKRYLQGEPEAFWWVARVRSAAAHLRAGTGILPYNPHRLTTYNTRESRSTPEEQRAAMQADAAWEARLGPSPGWEAVVTLFNAWACGDDDIDEDAPELLHYEDATVRAYSVATTNPDGRWEDWFIGGRFAGHFLAEAAADGLIGVAPAGPGAPEGRVGCDGGPIRSLDFAATGRRAAAAAGDRYSRWDALAAEHEGTQPWSYFHDQLVAGLVTPEAAWQEYRTQPAVAAAFATGLVTPGSRCPVEVFGIGRQAYVAAARRAAVPGCALITLDGRWVAAGPSGRYGDDASDTERDAYRTQVHNYLGELDTATVLVAIDCLH